MTRSVAAVARARAAIGTRFRLYGRDDHGVDCVGLVALAHRVTLPTGYALRTGDPDVVARAAAAVGFVAVRDRRPGDVIVMCPGAGQLHLGIATSDGVIHADTMLRRVVERPGTPPWPIVACWRKEN